MQYITAPVSHKLENTLVGNRVGSANTRRTQVSRVARLGVLCCLFSVVGVAQAQEVLCSAGNGSFQAKYESSGVTVQVRASRNGELATRTCDALLTWSKNALVVATNAAQVDVDEFGADLGLNGPVVAFQVKKTDADCCREYQIYSLKEPPRLLQTVTGAASFSAADTDLDGRVEIWTDDGAATSDIEGLTLGEFVPPTIILRFLRGKLFDASAEFLSYFDGEIAKLRAQLEKDDLQTFRNTDGRLSPNTRLSAEQAHRLRE